MLCSLLMLETDKGAQMFFELDSGRATSLAASLKNQSEVADKPIGRA
jgi:hypothetical protein